MHTIDTLRQTRRFLLSLLEQTSVEQWNDVPPHFNNNITWNVAHLIAAQQGVCYLRAGQRLVVDEAFYNRYKPGTRPEGFTDGAAIDEIKTALFSTLDQFETDYKNGLFQHYNAWTTRYGATLTTIEEALAFLLYHEGLHAGYIMALKRAVQRVPA